MILMRCSEGYSGIPMTLNISVVDVNTCQPIVNAAVDIWHCNAAGIYSHYQVHLCFVLCVPFAYYCVMFFILQIYANIDTVEFQQQRRSQHNFLARNPTHRQQRKRLLHYNLPRMVPTPCDPHPRQSTHWRKHHNSWIYWRKCCAHWPNVRD